VAAKGLTRERILDAALALLDEGGAGALSMRRLGAALGVDPMAVYRHVDGRRGLLLALAEREYAALPVPPADLPWEERVRRWAHALRDLGLAHPRLVLGILTDAEAIAVAAVTADEALWAALEDAGLAPADVVRAGDLIVDYVHGALLGEASAAVARVAPALREELARRPADRFPAQRRVLAATTEAQTGAPLAGLDVVLAGIRALAADHAHDHEEEPT